MSLKIDFKLTGAENILELLQKLPAEVVSKRGGPVKKALRKGAALIRDEAKANVRKIVAEPNKGGLPSVSTGELEKAIVATRGKPLPGQNGERYIVWLGKITRRYARTKHNVRKGRVGKEYDVEPPQFYGRFLEFGTSRMQPHPWLRPAFASKGAQAMQLAIDELNKDIKRIVDALTKGKLK